MQRKNLDQDEKNRLKEERENAKRAKLEEQVEYMKFLFLKKRTYEIEYIRFHIPEQEANYPTDLRLDQVQESAAHVLPRL